MMSWRELLDWFAKKAEQFRSTPVVDDDFPLYRDRFDAALRTVQENLDWPRPAVVCLCGSTRFMEAFQQANLTETLAGRIVLSVGCNTKSDADLQRMGQLADEKKRELDDLHKRKIDLADQILVLNVGGYIGKSTASEIDYALQQGKPVRYLESPHPEKELVTA